MHGQTASIVMTPQFVTVHWLHTCAPYMAHHEVHHLPPKTYHLVGRLRAAPHTCEQLMNATFSTNAQGVMSHLWLLTPAFKI